MESKAESALDTMPWGFDVEQFSDRVLCVYVVGEDKAQQQPSHSSSRTTKEIKDATTSMSLDMDTVDDVPCLRVQHEHDGNGGGIRRDVNVNANDIIKDNGHDAASRNESKRTVLPSVSPRYLYRKLSVSSFALAKGSTVFRALLSNGMRETSCKEIDVEVNSRAEAESLIWLIRAIYDVRDIKNVPSDDLIAFLIATDKFGAERLAAKCCTILSASLTPGRSRMLLSLPEAILGQGGNACAVQKAETIIVEYMHPFQDKWQTNELLELSEWSLCAILNSNKTVVTSENSLFQAVKRWWNESPHSPLVRKASLSEQMHAAEKLSSTLRYARMTVDFLLDVVRHHSWASSSALAALPTQSLPANGSGMMCDDGNCHPVDKRVYANVVTALEYLASSVSRRQSLLAVLAHKRSQSHIARDVVGSLWTTFYWTLPDVAHMPTDRFVCSDSFCVDGYYFNMRAGCNVTALSRHFALFLTLDLGKTGLDKTRPFFVPTFTQVWVWRNTPLTRSNHPNGLAPFDARNSDGFQNAYSPTYTDTPGGFRSDALELGYHDLLQETWDAVVQRPSRYLDEDGAMHIRLNVRYRPC